MLGWLFHLSPDVVYIRLWKMFWVRYFKIFFFNFDQLKGKQLLGKYRNIVGWWFCWFTPGRLFQTWTGCRRSSFLVR